MHGPRSTMIRAYRLDDGVRRHPFTHPRLAVLHDMLGDVLGYLVHRALVVKAPNQARIALGQQIAEDDRDRPLRARSLPPLEVVDQLMDLPVSDPNGRSDFEFSGPEALNEEAH